MALPKKKTAKGRQRRRRNHLALSGVKFVVCSHCKAMKLPHQVCGQCGYYNDKQIVEVDKSVVKKLS